MFLCIVFFFKQKTAYEMRISDWSSDVCSSDLRRRPAGHGRRQSRIHDPVDEIGGVALRTATTARGQSRAQEQRGGDGDGGASRLRQAGAEARHQRVVAGQGPVVARRRADTPPAARRGWHDLRHGAIRRARRRGRVCETVWLSWVGGKRTK